MDVAANLKLGEKMSKKEKSGVTTVSTVLTVRFPFVL
jgi:hypothetical protein